MLQIGLGILLFTLIIMLLVLVVLFARAKLVPSGKVKIEVHNAPERSFSTEAGSNLLSALKEGDIYLAAACGGGGIGF